MTLNRKAVALIAVALVLTNTAAAAGATNTPGALLYSFDREPVTGSGPLALVAPAGAR